MSFEISVTKAADVLCLNVSGVYEFENLFGFIDEIKKEADASGLKKVLVDCRDLVGNLTEADRFQGGQRIAQVLGSRLRTAVVMAQGEVTKLGEMAAINRGAVILITESIAEAREWLQAE